MGLERIQDAAPDLISPTIDSCIIMVIPIEEIKPAKIPNTNIGSDPALGACNQINIAIPFEKPHQRSKRVRNTFPSNHQTNELINKLIDLIPISVISSSIRINFRIFFCCCSQHFSIDPIQVGIFR